LTTAATVTLLRRQQRYGHIIIEITREDGTPCTTYCSACDKTVARRIDVNALERFIGLGLYDHSSKTSSTAPSELISHF